MLSFTYGEAGIWGICGRCEKRPFHTERQRWDAVSVEYAYGEKFLHGHHAAGLVRKHNAQATVQGAISVDNGQTVSKVIRHPKDAETATRALLRLQEELSLLEQSAAALEASGAQDLVVSAAGDVEQLRSHVEAETDRLTAAERVHEKAVQIEKAAKVVANEMIGEQVDTVLPLLKELYRRLRPHADWREIEIDIAGQVRASLNFSVGDGKNPQFLFSSGQRRAAGLAFLLAVHLSRPWCGLEALLLDDPVQHVDDYRALNLIEVLAAVRRSGRQVIVSVQDAALADILCRRLRSTVEERGKRFDLETDLHGSAIISGEHEIPALSRTVFEIAEAVA